MIAYYLSIFVKNHQSINEKKLVRKNILTNQKKREKHFKTQTIHTNYNNIVKNNIDKDENNKNDNKINFEKALKLLKILS